MAVNDLPDTGGCDVFDVVFCMTLRFFNISVMVTNPRCIRTVQCLKVPANEETLLRKHC